MRSAQLVAHPAFAGGAWEPTATSRLTWSEYGYLLVITLALLIAVDPLELGLGRHALVKHLPLLLTLPVLALQLAGRRLSLRRGERLGIGALFAAAWPLALLALLIVGGSAWLRATAGVQATFLNMGAYMAALFAAAAMVLASASPLRLARAYCRIVLAAALVMSAYLIAHFGGRQVYHEQIFLVIPMAAYCLLQWPGRAAGRIGLLFFLGMALFSAKNTSYIVALMVALYLAFFAGALRFGGAAPVRRLWGYYLAFVGLLGVAAGVAYLVYFRDVYLPSGNVEYRAHTYELAWQRFLDSPLWGTLFAEESVQKFTLYSIGIARNRLPTHSDVLDLLAHGGMLGIGLWLLGLARIGRLAWRGLLAPGRGGHAGAACGHTLALVSLAGIVTYAFNPILLQPGLAYLLWTTLGLLLGLALKSEASENPWHRPRNPSHRSHRQANRS